MDATYNDLTREILAFVSQSGSPVGAGTLYFHLREKGVDLSAPSVGRRLRELEVAGLLRKVGVEGRVTTKKGHQALRALEQERRLRASGEALLGALRLAKKEDVINLLTARRTIEREVARLATQKATPQDIEGMEEILARQQARVDQNELAVQEDIQFHEALAKTSGNKFFEVLVSLLRHHGQYSYQITRVRARSGSRLVVDHREILEAIKSRNPSQAELAMDHHLTKVISEVSQFWEEEQYEPGPFEIAPARE